MYGSGVLKRQLILAADVYHIIIIGKSINYFLSGDMGYIPCPGIFVGLLRRTAACLYEQYWFFGWEAVAVEIILPICKEQLRLLTVVLYAEHLAPHFYQVVGAGNEASVQVGIMQHHFYLLPLYVPLPEILQLTETQVF